MNVNNFDSIAELIQKKINDCIKLSVFIVWACFVFNQWICYL